MFSHLGSDMTSSYILIPFAPFNDLAGCSVTQFHFFNHWYFVALMLVCNSCLASPPYSNLYVVFPNKCLMHDAWWWVVCFFTSCEFGLMSSICLQPNYMARLYMWWLSSNSQCACVGVCLCVQERERERERENAYTFSNLFDNNNVVLSNA